MTALTYGCAVGLECAVVYFSVNGMVILFPGQPRAVMAMTAIMDGSKLVAAGWLSSHWQRIGLLPRTTLTVLILALAIINGAGTYSQLVQAHLGDRATATASIEIKEATIAGMISVQTQAVADVDKRIAQLDDAVAEMTKRGRTQGALSAIQEQAKARAILVSQRKHEADTLTNLKTEQATNSTQAKAFAIEMAPVRYAAELIGVDTERGVRWLILLVVLCLDPLAIVLMAVASANRA